MTPPGHAPGRAQPRVTALPPGPRHVHVEPVWGTVVTLELRGSAVEQADPQQLRQAVRTAVAWLHHVDAVFSPFRPESEVSRLPDATLGEAAACGDMREVLLRCRAAGRVTGGCFDPWQAPRGFDPSGLVKGWAAERAADLLVSSGFRHVKVDAGGDVVVRGGSAPGRPWIIGIQHPDDPAAVAATVALESGAIATSGTYERGEHVIDPATRRPAHGARAATVVGPDAGLADALATALLVAGRDGAAWIAALPGWSAWAVDRGAPGGAGGRTWSIGPAFAPEEARPSPR